MATRSMAIRIRAVIGVSFCRCTNFPTRPYEEPMKLSYFSYDFVECCCEAVKPGVCVGCFRWAWLLDAPVGGGPTTPLIPVPTPNFARNSPTTISNFEFRSLELQRFQPLLKLLPIELRASFLEATPCHHPPAPQRGPPPCRSQATQAGKNSPSTRKTPQNQHFFASRANFVTVRSMNHPRQALRPQPKPRVACAHATTPVAHWPHD